MALGDLRLELFALGLAQGIGKYEAYRNAGYKGGAAACSSVIKSHPELGLRVTELTLKMTTSQVVDRVVANKEWGLGKLQGIVETPAASPPKVSDHVAAITQMGKLAGWEPTKIEGRTAVEAAEVRQLTPVESKSRWADGIEEAAAHYQTDSVQELVAKMREAEVDHP